MRCTTFAALGLLLASPALALKPLVRPVEPDLGRAADRGGPAAAHPDTVWFGGSGTGNGSVVRGGLWTWEADSGEPPEFFLDGDPVGNQYRDGWTFEDRTTRSGPSQVGAGHWRTDGSYDFDFDGGAFAHRATTHANDGVNDGPDPLGSGWSVWIGTNLYLNPEHCGWDHTAGYGNGWSQGIAKRYRFRNAPGPGEFPAPPAGAALDLQLFHRYAAEASFDTCWTEISWDGVTWSQVGTRTDPNGIWSGGTRTNPLPGPGGGPATVILPSYPGGEADLQVRLRLASDAFTSDEGEFGDYLFAWQVDDLRLRVNGAPIDLADFESGMGGWEPRRFEGFDFALTGDPDRPAGRISPLASLACPIVLACPEQCGIEGNVLLFADRDDCDLGNEFADTFLTSPAFAIAGAAHPDLDGDAGRLIQYDAYIDGGSGYFETGLVFCWVYAPFAGNRCPYTPPGGAPGAGTTFEWSRTSFPTCDYFSMGVGPSCLNDQIDDISAALPASADSLILHVGAFSHCRSEATCAPNDNGPPFFDNIRFGVFDRSYPTLSAYTLDRYADNFPTANGDIVSMAARMDGATSLTRSLGIENPMRWVRGDSADAFYAAENAAVFLRFRVTPGPCQPNLDHPFFAAFPPNQWHAARMDTARDRVNGQNSPGRYMTCFHESDPRNGTHWTGTPPPVEPCDDILPDGLFTPGTVVHYFFETRNAGTGDVVTTFPRAENQGPIGTVENWKSLWLETGVLPELAPACDGTYAHNLLVVSDYQTNTVPGLGTVARDRLTATLASLGLDFDVYDCQGTNYTGDYDGIGRREDRQNQVPRPPYNGATAQQLEPYDCIWYYSGLLAAGTLRDQTTLAAFGGQASNDQQKLENWISGCTDSQPRLLVLEGLGWASDIDVNTSHGPAFLARFGVDVLARDYARQLAANDLRRCARVTGTPLAPEFDGEVFASGCPENYALDVFAATNGGEAVANFVESLEDGSDPVNCADDQNRTAWHAVVRKMNPLHACERSVAVSVPFFDLYSLNCADQCLFDDFRINGESAELVIALFQWAGMPINPAPIGVGEAGAPRFANALERARPNPANPSAVIRYSIAAKGRVTLRIFDAGGRLVRTLADEVRDAGEHAAAWDGRNDAGGRVASGVYFYELRGPGYAASRRLVVLR